MVSKALTSAVTSPRSSRGEAEIGAKREFRVRGLSPRTHVFRICGDSPSPQPSPRDEEKTHLLDPAARFARVVENISLRHGGSRECRVRAAPAVSCAKLCKETHTSIQVQRRQSGIPCAAGFNGLCRALPGDECLPSADRLHQEASMGRARPASIDGVRKHRRSSIALHLSLTGRSPPCNPPRAPACCRSAGHFYAQRRWGVARYLRRP
jgi:hypothetical protein